MTPYIIFAFLFSSAHTCAPSISDKVRRKSIYEATHSLAGGRLKFHATTLPSILQKENIIIKSSTKPLSTTSTTKPILSTQLSTTTFHTTERIETHIFPKATSLPVEATTIEGIVKNDVCALKDIGSEMRNIPVNMDESEAVIEFLINTQHEQTAILTCKGQKGKMTIIEISSQPSLRDESVEEDASLIVICNKGQWFSEDGLKVMNINCYHINSYLEQFE